MDMLELTDTATGITVSLPADTPTQLRDLDDNVLTIADVLYFQRNGYRVYDVDCGYSFSHTKHACGYPRCSDG